MWSYTIKKAELQFEFVRQVLRNYQPSIWDDRSAHVEASVLIPLVNTDDSLEFLFTVRTDVVEHHKGQVAFPGGAREMEDRDVYDTALRETREEIALNEDLVNVLGRIDDYVTPSGFVVSPVVGWIDSFPPLVLQPEEVADYFLAPVSFFLDDTNGYTRTYMRGDQSINVWIYEYKDRMVWGVTAAIIRNFKQVLESGEQSV